MRAEHLEVIQTECSGLHDVELLNRYHLFSSLREYGARAMPPPRLDLKKVPTKAEGYESMGTAALGENQERNMHYWWLKKGRESEEVMQCMKWDASQQLDRESYKRWLCLISIWAVPLEAIIPAAELVGGGAPQYERLPKSRNAILPAEDKCFWADSIAVLMISGNSRTGHYHSEYCKKKWI